MIIIKKYYLCSAHKGSVPLCLHIGNSIAKGTSQVYKRVGFEQVEHSDGSTSVVGGVTSENKNIIMNVGYSGLDIKKNRIHEIFHTLGLSHPKGNSVSDGIMNYPPKQPSGNDALIISNSSFLPSIFNRNEIIICIYYYFCSH